MSHEGKKTLFILGGVAGIAIIVILTTLAMKFILQSPLTQAPAEKPVVEKIVVEKAVEQPQPPAPTAQVIDVKPHYVSASIPKQRCRDVRRVAYESQESHTPGAGAVVGGVAGGLLGSQVGGGNGRLVTTAAGAAIGALTGNSVQNSMNAPQSHIVHSTVCSTHYVKTSIKKGYEVTYTYSGKQGVIIMDNPPMIGSVLPFPNS